MWVKRKDMEQIVEALRAEVHEQSPESLADALWAIVLGNRILHLHPDPVDVVPVHDYPFPLLGYF